jgi:hypothetical protein
VTGGAAAAALQRNAIAAIVNGARVIAPVHIILSLHGEERKRQNRAHMKTTALPLKHSMNRASCTPALLLIPLALACFALSPMMRADCQQGCSHPHNTFLGGDALLSNTGYNNTAMGYGALARNTSASDNTALGAFSLEHNTTGLDNTAIGYAALDDNAVGNNNTATGYLALFHNIAGYNTATGAYALWDNTTGIGNTAIGNDSLQNNTIGNNNIALGDSAGVNLTTGSNNIDIGNVGGAGESSTIRIGGSSQTNTYIGGINGVTVAGGIGVVVDSSGHLGTTTSSARFKDEVKPMDKISEAILALKPVTFRYKKELDPKSTPQFGLVAEDVEKVNPDLVARDDQGKPYTVRYEAVNAMLLNEFLKEHRKVEEQGATIMQLKTELQATATRQQKQIEALTEGLQKVSVQLELSNATPQTVSNNH